MLQEFIATCADDVEEMVSGWELDPEIENAIPAGPVRSPVRGSSESDDTPPIATPQFETLTTTAGTNTTPVAGNNIVIPAGHNGLMIYAGTTLAEFPLSRFRLVLYANVDGTVRTLHLYRGQAVVIHAAAGATVSLASQERVAGTYVLSSVAAPLVVVPIITPASLVAPSGVTGNVPCDRNGPPYWSPDAESAHVVLSGSNQTVQINSDSSPREIFLVEFDEEGTPSPIRHLHVPANQPLRVLCRFRRLALANFAGATVSVTCSTGATIGGSSTSYRPAFTLSGTSAVSDAASFITALQGAADGSDIVLASGTYNLSATPISQANYTTAMTRSVRIRSATGDPADVTINGAALQLVIAQNKQWVFEGVTFALAGLTTSYSGLIDSLGNTHFHDCVITGPCANSPTARPNIYLHGTSAFVTTPIFSFCVNQTSQEDNYDTDGNANLTLVVFGGLAQGAGAGANDQLVTSHSGTKIQCWGTRFKDATATANQTQIWPDEAAGSEIHLLYCTSFAADIANAEGMIVRRCQTMHFNTFEKVRVLSPATAGGATACCCWIGNRITKVTASTSAVCMRFEVDGNSYSLLAGNWFTANNVGGGDNHGLDARRTIESVGNIYECTSASNAVPLRIAPLGGPGSAQPNVVSINDRFIAANALFEMSTSANLGVDLVNALFTGSAVNMAVGASGANCSARNYYAERSSAPTNWSARFTTDSGGTFSATNVTFESDGLTPTTGFLSSHPGLDQGIHGAIDALGRPLYLGGSDVGSTVRGAIERQEMKTGEVLFPVVW